ncbi:MAG: SGNH/GDSL hydrolase family protein [Myxococcota bacterium]
MKGVSPSPRLRLQRLALVLVTLLSVAGTLELGLRASWEGYYLKTRRIYRQPHRTRGWENLPGIQLEYGKPEFAFAVRHDERGLRIPVAGPRPGDRPFRILVLGDSFAYGIGVEEEESFVAGIERAFPRVRTFNAGVAGYGTSQELQTLRELGPELAPDFVLLAFFWNDVPTSLYADVPRFTLEGGQLTYHPPGPNDERPVFHGKHVPPAILNHSYAYRFLSDRWKMLRLRVALLVGADRIRFEMLRPENLEQAWALERALLAEIARECRRQGAGFLFVVIPDQVQVDHNAEVVGLRPEDYRVQERLATIAREQGFEILDLLPGLRDAAERSSAPLYYRIDRHLTPAGHRAAGQLIVEALRPRLRAAGALEALSVRRTRPDP